MLTPVTNSAIVIESGSIRSDAFTCSGPDGEPREQVLDDLRDAREGRSTRPANVMIADDERAADRRRADDPAHGLPIRLPKARARRSPRAARAA